MIKQWIVEQPFSRSRYSSVTNGTVDYSGFLYNNGVRDLTVDEYLKHPQVIEKYKNPRVVDDAEFHEMYEQSERDMLSMFTEITEEHYYDMLECLPPVKWHDLSPDLNVFFISEATAGSLHACFIKQKSTGKYYEALRSIFETDAELIDIFNKSVNPS